MNIQHQDLAAGRWAELSFCERMANVGSEVSRALNWRVKNRKDYMDKALARAFELLELTIKLENSYPRLKELCRVRECLLDFFCAANSFSMSESFWRKYFDAFGRAARK